MTISRRQVLAALSTATAAGLTGIPAASFAQAGAREASAVSCFTMYDNSFYDRSGGNDGDPDVSAFLGIAESSIVYTTQWNSLFEAGLSPDETQFKNAVLSASNNRPGPVVIDAETIFFKDYNDGVNPPPPDKRVEIWTNLLTWAKEATGKRVGAYAFTSGATSIYFDYAKQVVHLMDDWFSYGYYSTAWINDFSQWSSRQTTYISISRKLEELARLDQPNLAARPIYTYLWPNYSPGTQPNVFIPRTLWRSMLDWINNNAQLNGAVLWSSTSTPTIVDRGWLDETKLFLDAHGC